MKNLWYKKTLYRCEFVNDVLEKYLSEIKYRFIEKMYIKCKEFRFTMLYSCTGQVGHINYIRKKYFMLKSLQPADVRSGDCQCRFMFVIFSVLFTLTRGTMWDLPADYTITHPWHILTRLYTTDSLTMLKMYWVLFSSNLYHFVLLGGSVASIWVD